MLLEHSFIYCHLLTDDMTGPLRIEMLFFTQGRNKTENCKSFHNAHPVYVSSMFLFARIPAVSRSLNAELCSLIQRENKRIHVNKVNIYSCNIIIPLERMEIQAVVITQMLLIYPFCWDWFFLWELVKRNRLFWSQTETSQSDISHLNIVTTNISTESPEIKLNEY